MDLPHSLALGLHDALQQPLGVGGTSVSACSRPSFSTQPIHVGICAETKLSAHTEDSFTFLHLKLARSFDAQEM